MKITKYIKLFVPPIFIMLLKNKTKNYWSGIYEKFSDIKNLSTYNSWGLSNDLIIAAKTFNELPGDKLTKSLTVLPHNSIMSIICLIHSVGNNSKEIHIIDFGGGAAIEYLFIKKTLKKETKINYTVVELDYLKDAIISMRESGDRVEFEQTFPDDSNADIVFSSTAIQYIEDWKDLIARFCKVKAKFIVLLRLVAGNNPTYVARQENLPGYYLPYRFFNWEEVVEEFKKYGYKLGFLSCSEKHYSQNNYPEKYRVERPCNLIFVNEN